MGIGKPSARAQAGKNGRWGCRRGHWLERHAGRPHDQADRLLLETAFVGLDDLVEADDVLGRAGERDLDDLAWLARDAVGGTILPSAGRVENGEPIGEARNDLAVDGTGS